MCRVMFVGIILYICVRTKAENFPSLITSNASLAIIIDREYVGDEYENIKADIENYLTYAKRELLKHGGVNHYFYSWTAINVRRDLSAVLSIASCSDTWKLFRSAEDEKLLHMAISETDCPRLPSNKAITIPLIKKGEEMPQLILDLRSAGIYNWKSVVIIYDRTLDRDMTTRVIKSITQQSNLNIKATGISLIKLERNITKYHLNEIMSTIRTKTVGGNFLVIVSHQLVETIMEYAKSLNLVDIKNQWLYIICDSIYNNSDITSYKRLLREGDNVAFVYNTSITSENCRVGKKCHSEEVLEGFMKALDEAIQDEYDIASQVSDEEWEAIRPTKLERRNYLLDRIKKHLARHGTCDNCTFWRMSTGETWGKEYQLANYFKNSEIQSVIEILPVGTWRPSDGPSMNDELFLHVAHGFRGKTLPVVSFHNPPWQILKINESGEVTEYTGLVFDIIKELSNNLNFTFTVEVVNKTVIKNSSVGNNSLEITNIATNSIPTEFIDMIRNKSVAFGACAFTVTEDNKHLINFTSPISIQTYTFLVARPKELSRALLFISPFTGDTWLCLSAAIISMGPILYYIHRFSPVYEYKGISMKGGLSSVQNCIWYMYGALLQQGGMHLPYADSARIIVGSWWLVVLVVATTYCGNLVAFLTFPKIDQPITTIDELIGHKDTVTWSFRRGSFLDMQLKTSTERRFRTLYDDAVKEHNISNLIKQIENGKHVFIDWKMRLQYIMKKQYLETDRCNLALGLDEFFDEQLALIVAQDIPYLPTINAEIKKLHQVGLIQKWLQDYLPKKDRCWKNRHIIEVNNHTVNMDDMQGSFFVLFFDLLSPLPVKYRSTI
ncbi:ionotropic receptor 93a isoform X2 [Anoplophora glabripennis]|uniref:ionotropic receptor 93a isoform X2 n=1 Tax=Anoplophora glabripennis TaxID=217634 RepID=UPI0008740D89|nr:ionotropic receptor 93a isoform X2 [Anoplophora glabripennis]